MANILHYTYIFISFSVAHTLDNSTLDERHRKKFFEGFTPSYWLPGLPTHVYLKLTAKERFFEKYFSIATLFPFHLTQKSTKVSLNYYLIMWFISKGRVLTLWKEWNFKLWWNLRVKLKMHLQKNNLLHMCIILFMFDGIMLISAKLPILLDSQSLTLRRVGNFWI